MRLRKARRLAEVRQLVSEGCRRSWGRNTAPPPLPHPGAAHPRTACSRRREGYAVRTLTRCFKMSSLTHSTRCLPPLAMKAGIHRMLPLRLCSRCSSFSRHVALTKSSKARWTTEGFMVTRSVLSPTSRAYSCTGARLHLPDEKAAMHDPAGKAEAALRILNLSILYFPCFLLIPKQRPRAPSCTFWSLLASLFLLLLLHIFIGSLAYLRASQLTQQWKSPPAGDESLIPGSGRSPGGGNGNPFQYSCLENPTDRGA